MDEREGTVYPTIYICTINFNVLYRLLVDCGNVEHCGVSVRSNALFVAKAFNNEVSDHSTQAQIHALHEAQQLCLQTQ